MASSSHFKLHQYQESHGCVVVNVLSEGLAVNRCQPAGGSNSWRFIWDVRVLAATASARERARCDGQDRPARELRPWSL